MIGILLVDDHPLVRAGLRALIETSPDLVVVGEAANGDEAVELARRQRPDVTLMDLSLPGIDGIETTRRILAEDETACVLVLTAYSDTKRTLNAIDAGAIGYLLKDVEPTLLLEGIRAAVRGESPLDSRVANALVRARAKRQPAPQLTAREREVLSRVRGGLANKQIARSLGISEKTVKAHLTKIFNVLGVTDRTQAALWAAHNDIPAAN